MGVVDSLVAWDSSPHAGLSVRVYTAPGTSHAYQDAWLAIAQDDGWRVAAIDGVSPPPSAASFAGIDAGVWAATVVGAALRAQTPIGDALVAAHQHLWDPAVRPSRRQAAACATAAEVWAGGAGHLAGRVVSAGDCEAWVRRGCELTRLVGGDIMYPTSRAHWDSILGGRDPFAFVELEGEVLDGPEHRRTDPIGRYEHLRVELASFHDADELILGSDGARLGEWVDSGRTLADWLVTVVTDPGHRDLTVVQVAVLS